MSETNPIPSKHPEADKWGADMLTMIGQLQALREQAEALQEYANRSKEIVPKNRVDAVRTARHATSSIGQAVAYLECLQADLGFYLKQ